MSHFCRGMLLIVALAAPVAGSVQGSEERNVEGRVLDVKVTLCQLKPRGCAGFMILDAYRRDRPERFTVRVQLGVPIRRGDDYVLLGTLVGSMVKVVYVTEEGTIVARWIDVLDRTAPK